VNDPQEAATDRVAPPWGGMYLTFHGWGTLLRSAAGIRIPDSHFFPGESRGNKTHMAKFTNRNGMEAGTWELDRIGIKTIPVLFGLLLELLIL